MNKQFSISKALVFSLIMATAFVSCKKETAAPPPPPEKTTGTLLTYTNIDEATFDRIEIIVDGVKMGTLTKKYLNKPDCGDGETASNTAIQLTPGVHMVSAIQYKNDTIVDEWQESSETIKAGYCTRINWVE